VSWQRWFRVRRWKDRLPEAGAFFAGGVAKDRLGTRDRTALARFRLETVRAERVHWILLCSGPLHLLWCRLPVGLGMIAFGVAFNVPFIVIQRYNRGRLDRILSRPAPPTAR
jgi:glycosyl-4,4'-diaponeurosporenoate acyltransferase